MSNCKKCQTSPSSQGSVLPLRTVCCTKSPPRTRGGALLGATRCVTNSTLICKTSVGDLGHRIFHKRMKSRERTPGPNIFISNFRQLQVAIIRKTHGSYNRVQLLETKQKLDPQMLNILKLRFQQYEL